jgi:hypothetical protein
VSIMIEDQYPVSEKKSIEVLLLDDGAARNYANVGKLKWEFQLQPGEKKVLSYKYSVKYPKAVDLYVE